MDEVIVGTYEGFLLGYSISYENEVRKFKQTFATHSHTASVRCLSMAGKFLASGGTDDKVVIIDMKSRVEHTAIMNHEGTVNSVAFTNSGTHLITASDDGSIIVTRVGNWKVEKKWSKAHGGQPVTAIAVHPTDKLALTIGGDKTLRTWNLIKGRPAFTINLGSKGVTLPTEVKFSPGGDRFSLVSQQTVDIWTISKAGVEKRITCNSKPSCVQWVSDEKLLVGLDNGHIISFTISDTQAKTYSAHKNRVKCLHFENGMLYSASSSGELKAWTLSDKGQLTEICFMNANCRVTSISFNKQMPDIKKEEDETEQNEEEYLCDEPNEVEVVPIKRKPGAFVTVNYDDDADDQAKDTEVKPPAKKKRKRTNKKQNKKN